MVLGQRGARLRAGRAGARSADSSRPACPGAGRSARRSPTSPPRSARGSSELLAGREHGDRRQRGGRAGAEQNGGLEEVDEPHGAEAPTAAPRAVPARRRCRRRSGRPRAPAPGRFVGADRHADRALPAPRTARARAVRERRRGRWCRRPTYSAAATGAPRSSVAMPRPLSRTTGGRTSSTLRPQWTAKPSLLREPGDLLHGRRGRLFVGRAAPVERRDRVLVLAAHADPLMLAGVGARGERAHARGPGGELGVDLGPGRARGAAARRRGCRCRRSSRSRRSGARWPRGGR